MATSDDLFIQFKDATATTNASNSTTLAEGSVKTGLSVRGALIWLIHAVEIFFPKMDSGGERLIFALSTVAGKAAMPKLGEVGTICKADRFMEFTTSGMAIIDNPLVVTYFPPVPLAAPNLSVYVQTATDAAAMRSLEVEARVLFTTNPLDAKVYTEIAETWGY